MRLAVLVLTRNEEKNIEACLKSASCADEFVLVDSGSEDRTCVIAEGLGAKVYNHDMGEEGFAGQRNLALSKTDADWVFYIDADERLTQEASEEIRRIVDSGELAAYAITRTNVVFGKPLHHGAHAPDSCLRLFPRDSVHWVGKVHERPQTELVQKHLRGGMHHFTYESLDDYFHKFNLYTTFAADKLYKEKKSVGSVKLWLDPPFTFFKMYVLKQGWRDGWLGLVMSMLSAFYVWVKYLKLALLERKDKA